MGSSIDVKKYPGFSMGWDVKHTNKYLGDMGSTPGLKIAIVADGKKYVKKVDAFKKEEISSYLNDWIAGNIKPSYKSAELKEKEEKGVTILTGNNFEDIALSPKLDVFVKFYAPWCGHCKALAPAWEELASKIKNMGLEKKVIIAKFDATENECEVPIEGYPKIFFFPAAKQSIKKKTEFSGPDRTASKLLEFLGE